MIYPKNQLSWAVPYLVLILYQVHGANVSIGNAITNYYPTYAEIAISQILKLIKLLKSSFTFKIVPSTISAYMNSESLAENVSWRGYVGKYTMVKIWKVFVWVGEFWRKLGKIDWTFSMEKAFHFRWKFPNLIAFNSNYIFQHKTCQLLDLFN